MSTVNPTITLRRLDALLRLRPAGGAVLTQLALHQQLALVEWAQEKNRLLKMLLLTLVGFACLLSLLLWSGVLVVALSWDTAYRIHALVALALIYALALALAWRRLGVLAALGEQSFAATREELAADLALLKDRL